MRLAVILAVLLVMVPFAYAAEAVGIRPNAPVPAQALEVISSQPVSANVQQDIAGYIPPQQPPVNTMALTQTKQGMYGEPAQNIFYRSPKPAQRVMYIRMPGSPRYILKNSTITSGSAGPCQTSVENNKTVYSCITESMARGSMLPYDFYTTGSGVGAQCMRGSTKCVGNAFIRCIGGYWVSAQNCRRSEQCTGNGCRILRITSQPHVSVSPLTK
jgi:hypothetical protein